MFWNKSINKKNSKKNEIDPIGEIEKKIKLNLNNRPQKFIFLYDFIYKYKIRLILIIIFLFIFLFIYLIFSIVTAYPKYSKNRTAISETAPTSASLRTCPSAIPGSSKPGSMLSESPAERRRP